MDIMGKNMWINKIFLVKKTDSHSLYDINFTIAITKL